MAANIDSIAIVTDGAGDAADAIAGLEYDGPNRRFSAELERRS